MKLPTFDNLQRFRAIPMMRDSSTARSLYFDVYRRTMSARFGVLVLDEFPLVELEQTAEQPTFDGLHFVLFAPAAVATCDVDFTPREVRGAIGTARVRLNNFDNRHNR